MFRRLSWIALMAGLVLPATWAAVQVAAFNDARPGPGCGMPVLAIYGTALLAAGGLSVLASVFAGLAYRRLPAPRRGWRLAEWVAVTLPALFAVVVLTLVLAGG